MKKVSRRNFVLASVIGVGAYTWQIEPHWYQITQRVLKMPDLRTSWQDATIVQLSDLHIGPQVSDHYLKRVFSEVEDLAPDLVVYTGDLTTYSSRVRQDAERMFPSLPHGKRGTFGILGNHDYGAGFRDLKTAQMLTEVARHSGVEILRNQVTDLDGLLLAGLDDLWSGEFDPQLAFQDVPTDQPTLILSHNPDTADLPDLRARQGWILAGHTHGGQCKPPFLPPPRLPVQNRNYVAGQYNLAPGLSMYVNRGLGHLLKVRFNARPEVTVFTLQSA